MAYTQADADALRQAIAKGAKKLKMGDEEVEYRSLSEMERVLARIEASLAGSSSDGLTVSYPVAGRGL